MRHVFLQHEEPAIPGLYGKITYFRVFPSTYATPRGVLIWTPPQMEEEPERRFPVIYMHDGQNLFDPETVTMKGIDWGVDEAVQRLVEAGSIEPPIVVGIESTRRRYQEYMPQRACELLRESPEVEEFYNEYGPVVSDGYLKFIVDELKAFMDIAFPTKEDPQNNYVMGSSMGGLISLYAVMEYPQVFGGAACLSTHWVAGKGIVVPYIDQRLPDPSSNKLYFDYGTEGLDAGYEPYQMQVDDCLQRAGYRQGENWITRKYPGADHNEAAWRERVDIPLEFLLRKR